MSFVRTEFTLVHIKEGDKHDFNLIGLPDDLILSLIGYLGQEHQRNIAIACAPSFKQERLLQHERYLEKCALDGTTPKQLFLDLPL